MINQKDKINRICGTHEEREKETIKLVHGN
jgi:hypothetical protein